MENKEKEIIKGLIENGNIKEALEYFDQFSGNNRALNLEVVKLKSRFQINQKHELSATLDTREIAVENNKIVNSTLELLNHRK